MPLTLPTHPVAVVPLKLWRPRWFDGVGLVIGAVAPDIAYAAAGYGVTIHSHAWHAPLWWAVPLALVGGRLVRWMAPVVAVHLPAGGRFALRDYGVLGGVRHPWWVTAWSAALGAVSHVVWDAFTHPYVDGGRLLFPWLHHPVTPGLPWWELLVRVSDLAGFGAGLRLALHLGKAGCCAAGTDRPRRHRAGRPSSGRRGPQWSSRGWPCCPSNPLARCPARPSAASLSSASRCSPARWRCG